MPDETLAADVSDCRDRITDAAELRLIEATRLPDEDAIGLDTPSLSAAVGLARDLDCRACYLAVDRTDSGAVSRAAVGFFHNGVLHTASRVADRQPAGVVSADTDDAGDGIDDEEALARIVFRDGRFNDSYTVADTEMLLNALDIEYDAEAVSLESVHRRAMELPADE
jgi:hypothetical protein